MCWHRSASSFAPRDDSLLARRLSTSYRTGTSQKCRCSTACYSSFWPHVHTLYIYDLTKLCLWRINVIAYKPRESVLITVSSHPAQIPAHSRHWHRSVMQHCSLHQHGKRLHSEWSWFKYCWQIILTGGFVLTLLILKLFFFLLALLFTGFIFFILEMTEIDIFMIGWPTLKCCYLSLYVLNIQYTDRGYKSDCNLILIAVDELWSNFPLGILPKTAPRSGSIKQIKNQTSADVFHSLRGGWSRLIFPADFVLDGRHKSIVRARFIENFIENEPANTWFIPNLSWICELVIHEHVILEQPSSRPVGVCFQNNGLCEKYIFGPLGHFSAYWCLGMMGHWNNGMTIMERGVIYRLSSYNNVSYRRAFASSCQMERNTSW